MKSLGETDVIIKPEYQFRIEEFKDSEDHQMVFLHLNVSSWNPSVAKEILRNWKLFRECVTCPVYGSAGAGDTEKWEKFVSALGFTFLTNVICENGQERRLFVHTIKNKKNEQFILTEHNHDPATAGLGKLPGQSLGRANPVPDAGVPERRLGA